MVAPSSRHDRGREEQLRKEHESDLSPLVERLRTMDWSSAPDGARERCLEEILNRVGAADRRDDTR
jgi:hypothetical protein